MKLRGVVVHTRTYVYCTDYRKQCFYLVYSASASLNFVGVSNNNHDRTAGGLTTPTHPTSFWQLYRI